MSFPNPGDLIKPWSWDIAIEGVVWFVVILVGGLIWIWTRSGTSRKSLPDILGRNVEDFAGVTQEGNGPIPIFLLVLYMIIALAIIGYPAITLVFNYKY